jgi:hypothetical protein
MRAESLRCSPSRIIATKGSNQVCSVISGERGASFPLIACINALGNPVLLVLTYPRFTCITVHGTSHPSGWSNSETFTEFLDHFIQHEKQNKDKKVLLHLLMDNREIHGSITTIKKARENGILMLTLATHAIHKVRPLDRRVFGPIKNIAMQQAVIGC